MLSRAESGPVAILDFETTGMSPDRGARVTEVGVAVVADGQIVDAFQSLMNAGVRIPSFIEDFTGISNRMIRRAPPAAEVVEQLAEFIGDTPLVAHNASFDRRFLDVELARIGRCRVQDMACSMLIARRVFPEAPSHSLGNLVQHLGLPTDGIYHRALADATMTAHLWLHMQRMLCARLDRPAVSFALMKSLQTLPRSGVATHLDRICQTGP